MEDQVLYAYLAGLFDGEGTITLSKINSGEFRSPTLSMSSTSLNLLEICKSTFGGSISKQKVYKDHHRQSWSWKVSYKSALIAIGKLYPFIQEPEKKRRMSLVLSKFQKVTPRNGKYSNDLRAKKLDFEAEFFHPSNSIAVP